MPKVLKLHSSQIPNGAEKQIDSPVPEDCTGAVLYGHQALSGKIGYVYVGYVAKQKGGVLFATCFKMLAIPKVPRYQRSVDQVDREWDVYQICSRTLVPTCFLSDSPLYSFF